MAADDSRAPVSADTAAEHERALLQLSRAMRPHCLHSRLVRRVGLHMLRLRSVRWFPPELIVFAPPGQRLATVTMGARSRSYVITRGDHAETIPADPERCASVVAGYIAEAPS